MTDSIPSGSVQRRLLFERDSRIADLEAQNSRLGEQLDEFVEQRIPALEAERDAWRAATGLGMMTPDAAGDAIDAMDDERARLREEVARLKAAIAEHKRACQDGGPHLVDKDRALWSVLESLKE